jgi:hypothetical protein
MISIVISKVNAKTNILEGFSGANGNFQWFWDLFNHRIYESS